MNQATDFERSNQAFLQAALHWLRALLHDQSGTPAARAAPVRRWWWSRTAPATTPVRAIATVVEARAALDEAAAAQPSPAFVHLARRLGLSAFERDLLLLAAAMELDTGLPAAVAAAQGDLSKRHPTFALAMSLFAEPCWDAMSPERPLRALRLLELHQSGAASLLAAPLRIDERIAAYIKGLNYLDERLTALATPLQPLGELPPSQEQVAQVLARWLGSEDARGVVQLTGSDAAAKTDVVARAATVAGRLAMRVRADAMLANADDAETWAQLWSREALLLPLLLYVEDAAGVPLGDEPKAQAPLRWMRSLSRIQAPVAVDTRSAVAELGITAALAVDAPTDAERRALWRHALTVEEHVPSELDVAALAGEFRLSASQLADLSQRALLLGYGDDASAPDRVSAATAHAWASCVQHTAAALSGVTRWVAPRAKLQDIELPPSERGQLERLIAHARHRRIVSADFGFEQRGGRGLGLTALFHGESGTGKTYAAEAVASAMSLGLAVVDFAKVSSKWVGEAEKNWSRVFDAAERGGAVLFIDEADAKFSKRRDGSTSQDHYINAEIDYLLTRMENYSGIAILATNMKHALDPAFMRRLRFVVGFPFPGVAQRKAIWQTVFPAVAPLGELDFDRLARFSLTGGSIFNAALGAAHAAAAEGASVEMPHVLDAIRWEMRKLERPVAEGEFRWAMPAPSFAAGEVAT